MRIGLIPTAGSVTGDVGLAKRAEAAGFDGVYTIDEIAIAYTPDEARDRLAQ